MFSDWSAVFLAHALRSFFLESLFIIARSIRTVLQEWSSFSHLKQVFRLTGGVIFRGSNRGLHREEIIGVRRGS